MRKRFKLSRRQVLKAGGIGVAGLAALKTPFISRHAKAASGELNIAVVNSLSGRFARYGSELKRGVDLAVAAANGSGFEVGGTPVKINITEYDDRTEAVTAARLVERAMSNERTDLVIAGVGSVNVKTVIPVAQRLRTPMVAFWAQVDGVFAGQKGAPYVFGPMPPFSLYYTQILEMASKLDNPSLRRVAVITPQDELGIFTVNEYIPSDVEKAGLELVSAEFFPPGTLEFHAALDRVRRTNPDIFIINCYTPEIIPIFKEMQATNYFPPMVIVEAPTALAEALGEDLEGVFAPTFWDPTLDTTSDPIFGTSREFAAAYERAYGTQPPDFVAANGANTIVTAMLAFAAVGGRGEPEALRQAFIDMNTETFFSTLRFGDDGLNRGGAVYPSQFQGGVPRLVYPPELATADIIHPLPVSTRS